MGIYYHSLSVVVIIPLFCKLVNSYFNKISQNFHGFLLFFCQYIQTVLLYPFLCVFCVNFCLLKDVFFCINIHVMHFCVINLKNTLYYLAFFLLLWYHISVIIFIILM